MSFNPASLTSPAKSAAVAVPVNNRDHVIAIYQAGVGAASVVLLVHRIAHSIVLLSGLAGCSADSTIAATAQTDFVLAYVRAGVTTPIGTFRFAAGSTAATLVNVVVPILRDGDVLMLTGPATADATLANIGYTIYGQKV